jgi:hypothetical protein
LVGGPATSVVCTLTMRLLRSVSVVAEACRTGFAADADLMGASGGSGKRMQIPAGELGLIAYGRVVAAFIVRLDTPDRVGDPG